MKNFIKSLHSKNIHVVGVTGAEGSSILRFLKHNQIDDITVHDFVKIKDVEKSFRTWHRGINGEKKKILYQRFLKDLQGVDLKIDGQYLQGIDQADIVFIPQSWRLYEQNKLLFSLQKKKTPFYSITRLYLDFSPATVVAVTGTVGKGSVAWILFQLLSFYGIKAYFTGNETWRLQLADHLMKMKEDEVLVLEISHRQLQDGFSRPPKIAIVTNLYPNHLDEVDFLEYKNLKLSLIRTQTSQDISVLNSNNEQLRLEAKNINSKVLYYSTENKIMNSKNIQRIFNNIMNTKTVHYQENILAASTAAAEIGIPVEFIVKQLSKLTALPARIQSLGKVRGVEIINDIKSTTPWATIAAVKRLSGNIILICGGDTKNIDYLPLVKEITGRVKKIIVLPSPLGEYLMNQNQIPVKSCANVKDALKMALLDTEESDKIIISPSGAFFYSEFIKGKASLKKIVTSLLQEGQVLAD